MFRFTQEPSLEDSPVLSYNYKVRVFCVRRYRRRQCYGGIPACCAGVRFTVEAGTPLHSSIHPSNFLMLLLFRLTHFLKHIGLKHSV
jgi:hypothetical protein